MSQTTAPREAGELPPSGLPNGLPRCIASPVRIGRVVSVSGGRVIALLERMDDRAADVQVGALVKIVRPTALVFGIVEGLSIPIPRDEPGEHELPIAEINLLGEVPDAVPGAVRSFRRGVSSTPALDDAVLAADSDDTAAVYALPERQAVRIGTVHQDSTVSAYVSVDDLLARHFAIVGATGSGKSCALALILQGIIEANPNGHILLLDPHGEYGKAFGERAEHLTVSRLRLPYWILNFEELTEIFFGAEKDGLAAETQCLRQLVLKARLAYAQGKRDCATIEVDTPTPYTLSEVSRLLDEEMGRIDNRSTLGPYLRVKARLATLQADPRYAFLFPKGLAMRDNLASLLGQLFRVPTDGKPLCILDLVGVPTEVLNAVVAVLCRMAFDVAVSAGHRLPLLLVCEEAHRYAPQDSGLGFEPAKRSLARIAKEGRKYGISLGMVSQRPSDLAVSILSQCSTVLAFRMVNDADQEVIQAALSDVSSALVTSLPLLGNGEAVIVGEGVSVPMRLHLAQLPPDRRPRSSSSSFSRRWQNDEADLSVLESIVDCWRGLKQDRVAQT
jgi:energy-coupling factor transporter ATP-binding protein EcfA2